MILDITSTPPEFEEHPTTLPRAIDLAQAEETHLLGLKLSRGVLLQVEGQAEGARHIQLSPRVGANVARLSGTLHVPSPSTVASVVMRMYATLECLPFKASPTPGTGADEQVRAGAPKLETVHPLWSASSTQHQPRNTEGRFLLHPWTFEMPTRLELPIRPGLCDAPPSFQRDSLGVNHFIEIVVERKKFSFKRNSHDVLPIVYLPLSPHPSITTSPRPPEKGSPVVPPKDPLETSTQIDGAFVWCSVLLPNKRVAVRGEPLSVLISVACGADLSDGIIPSCFSIKMRELGQPTASGVSASKTVSKASELTYYPFHLLPRPKAMKGFAVGALDYRAFAATLEIGLDVAPSFSTGAMGPRAEYEIELRVKLPKAKEQLISSPLTVINCSTAPYELSKTYHKQRSLPKQG